eukprot:TRINITY_DN2024_c0_g1_i1.p1 TRINITY_DN2024_c0_g1~~TRINITY_DN2024_c0_g1_i1.p1  ORF type:complete len:213 (+),score=20.34 TRINITY_DN2024_c0_g1_i1:39-677(+)
MKKVIFALGNPGRAHATQKHNAGQIVLSRIVRDLGLEMKAGKRGEFVKVKKEKWEEVLERKEFQYWKKLEPEFSDTYLVLSNSYMNLSGAPAKSWVEKRLEGNWENMFVVHDELDLPLGTVKMRGLKKTDMKLLSHNGVRNVCAAARGALHCRLRIGVGRGRPLAQLDSFAMNLIQCEHERCLLACLLFASSIPLDRIMTVTNTGKEKADAA